MTLERAARLPGMTPNMWNGITRSVDNAADAITKMRLAAKAGAGSSAENLAALRAQWALSGGDPGKPDLDDPDHEGDPDA